MPIGRLLGGSICTYEDFSLSLYSIVDRRDSGTLNSVEDQESDPFGIPPLGF
ncbi:hypothetical protein TorRG33x02_068310 [Trema orientale]|uniref:Uncharacterized protein n=1 Tax=Trema orientale TaxID=63057 RepID=A0A2P5FHV8_TREOI|nr:hypothetical protein TorRG33x02_068310 [Trema orientale]